MTASIEENDRLLRDLQIGMQRIRDEVESINERQREILKLLNPSRWSATAAKHAAAAAISKATATSDQPRPLQAEDSLP